MKILKDLLQLSDRSKSVGLGTVIDGVAKAWVSYDSAASVRDSLNVSSMTDVGAGRHLPSFTNVFASTNYIAVGCGEYPSQGWPSWHYGAKTAGSIQANASSGGTHAFRDAPQYDWQFTGDLA